MSIISKTSVTQTITSLLKCGAIALLVLFVVAVMLPVIGRPHRSGGRQIKDGTQVRNLVQACFSYSTQTHPYATEAEEAAMNAMQAEAVVEPVDSHQPPAK